MICNYQITDQTLISGYCNYSNITGNLCLKLKKHPCEVGAFRFVFWLLVLGNSLVTTHTLHQALQLCKHFIVVVFESTSTTTLRWSVIMCHCHWTQILITFFERQKLVDKCQHFALHFSRIIVKLVSFDSQKSGIWLPTFDIDFAVHVSNDVHVIGRTVNFNYTI